MKCYINAPNVVVGLNNALTNKHDKHILLHMLAVFQIYKRLSLLSYVVCELRMSS